MVDCLMSFAKLRVSEQNVLVVEWIKCANSHKFGGQDDRHKVFLLPGCSKHRICAGGIGRLIGHGRRHWKSCLDAAKANTLPTHGLSGRPSNHKLGKVHADSFKLFFDKMESLAAPRATNCIRGFTKQGTTVTETRDDDVEVVECPSVPCITGS